MPDVTIRPATTILLKPHETRVILEAGMPRNVTVTNQSDHTLTFLRGDKSFLLHAGHGRRTTDRSAISITNDSDIPATIEVVLQITEKENS